MARQGRRGILALCESVDTIVEKQDVYVYISSQAVEEMGLMEQDITPRRACEVAIVWGLTDEEDIQKSLTEVVTSIFP